MNEDIKEGVVCGNEVGWNEDDSDKNRLNTKPRDGIVCSNEMG